jgi:hypothetical protein
MCNWKVVSWDACLNHRCGQYIFYNIASLSTKPTLNYYLYVHKVGAFIICRTIDLLRPDTSRSKVNILVLSNRNYLKGTKDLVIFERGSLSKSGI